MLLIMCQLSKVQFCHENHINLLNISTCILYMTHRKAETATLASLFLNDGNRNMLQSVLFTYFISQITQKLPLCSCIQRHLSCSLHLFYSVLLLMEPMFSLFTNVKSIGLEDVLLMKREIFVWN